MFALSKQNFAYRIFFSLGMYLQLFQTSILRGISVRKLDLVDYLAE